MILLMVTTFREEQKSIFLFERKIWSDHPSVVPTRNTKMCNRHFVFVSGIAVSDPISVDYIPSVNMGYEKQRSTRRTETSTKVRYWTNSNLATVLDEEGKRRATGTGVAVPEIGAEATIGIVQPS